MVNDYKQARREKVANAIKISAICKTIEDVFIVEHPAPNIHRWIERIVSGSVSDDDKEALGQRTHK